MREERDKYIVLDDDHYLHHHQYAMYLTIWYAHIFCPPPSPSSPPTPSLLWPVVKKVLPESIRIEAAKHRAKQQIRLNGLSGASASTMVLELIGQSAGSGGKRDIFKQALRLGTWLYLIY